MVSYTLPDFSSMAAWPEKNYRKELQHGQKRIFEFGDLSWPFVTWSWPWLVLSMTLVLTGYLQKPFHVTLGEFWAKATDIAGPGLHHTETSKFDLWPDLDPKLKVNLKILSMLWEELVENFRTPPRGVRYDHWFSREQGRGDRIRPPLHAVVGTEIAQAVPG